MDTRLDWSIQATSNDAVRAKEAAVRAGYYKDPFISAYLPSSPTTARQHHTRRPPVQPIIKRGTHARVACMDRAIAEFVKACNEKQYRKAQVVVLGAGKDTTFARLQSNLLQTPVAIDRIPEIAWFEVDHDVTIREKAAVIEKTADFPFRLVRQTDRLRFAFRTMPELQGKKASMYHIVAQDLREDPNCLFESLGKSGFDETLPTLFAMECVQMYLPETASRSLLKRISLLPQAYLVQYEPILGSDAFGKMMENNLVKAGVANEVSCLLQTRTLGQQLAKVRECGLSSATGCDMWSAYETILTAEQRRRANACEFLDELEEWVLIMRHYSFMVASTNKGSLDYCAVGKRSPLGFLEGKCETC